jgi:hypothetical protein
MKIRMQRNSIRFRLKQFEVEDLAEKKFVKEVIVFGNEEKDQLQLILKVGSSDFSLEQKTTAVQLIISERVANQWMKTDLVGFEQKIRTAKGKEINILVEKDFKCLTRSDEEEVGSYPNLMKQC